MGLAGKLFRTLTCGLGPRCREKFKDTIHYNEWHLRWQIIFSVSVFLVGLQIVIQVVAQIYFDFMFDRISESMTTKIDDELKSNFIGQAKAIESNILTLVLNWDHQLSKIGGITAHSMPFNSDYFYDP